MEELAQQLAKEDLEQQRTGITFLHDTSPAVFLRQALVVEAAQ